MDQFKKLNILISGQIQAVNASTIDPFKNHANQFEKINREIYKRREEERLANIETAENTAEMKDERSGVRDIKKSTY